MSRIDDDRQKQMVAERLRLEQAKKEQGVKTKAEGENAFSRLMKGQEAGQKQQVHEDKAFSLESLLGEAKKGSDSSSRELGKSFGDKLKQGDSRGSEKAFETKGTEQQVASEGASEQHSEIRKTDDHTSTESFSQKGEDIGKGGSAQAGNTRGGGALKADQDGGGGKGSGGGNKDQGGGSGNLPAGFRFNPALMAPVPVAKQREVSGSERLAKICNEIAQKIVERARVGTNAAGNTEFQIDLRSNVLKGLSIKVSIGNGKISANFSGNDKEVLKLLRENQDSLKNALGGRGLTLEELKIEDKA
jgi:hypothetical protein